MIFIWHNGIHETLEEVLSFYEGIAEGDMDELNPNVSQEALAEEVQDTGLDENEIDEIIAFLNALNDDDFDKRIPEKVPSGLSVGGNIK